MKVIDMHCDTLSALLGRRDKGEAVSLRSNEGHLDLMRMREAGYLVQNFAMFVPLGKDGDPWDCVCRLHRYYEEELEKNRDILAPVLNFGDIGKNEAEGRLSVLLTVEEGGVCKGEMEKLHALYRMGVRMITLTWNYDNEIGHPNFDRGDLRGQMKASMKAWKDCPADGADRETKRLEAQQALDAYLHTPNLTGGLTALGREMVEEMERLGIIPDVSHLSDAGFYDVLDVARKPFVASHSNARAVCPSVRNMTDDMIRRLSERGGVMGLNFNAAFLEERPLGEKNPGSVAAVVRHAKHIASVGGIGVLGLGSDFDGIDTNEGLPGAQSMGVLWDALGAAGFHESELDKIFCKNVLRAYRDALG